MAMTIHIDIVSAEAGIFSGTAEMVFAPAVMGEIGIMPHHSPLLSPLEAGDIRVRKEGGKEESFYVSGGMLEIQPHVITVLADTAKRADDIDEQKALEDKERAEKTIKEQTFTSKYGYAEARAELIQAIAQLRTLRRARKMQR